MGLLDDAIREHLELKLRHGADAADVARQEQDALGPVRREPDPEPVSLGAEEDLEPPTQIVPPDGGDDEYEDEDEDEDEDEYEDDEELTPAVPAQGPGGSVPALGETEEWGFEDTEEEADDAPAEEEGEDVLEQTPEFLSETPEHDRLWFEQKPPRDFDFDG